MLVSPIGKTYAQINYKSCNSQNNETNNDCGKEPCNKRKINWAKTTGWTATGALATAAISGMTVKPKLHIVSATIATFAAAAHIGFITSHHSKKHK